MIKNWKLFRESIDIQDLCKEYNINNYTINSDGSIDVDGDVDLSSKKLDKIPLRFRDVSGDFWCYDNKKLKDLSGAPSSVGGDFWCYDNKLTDLRGAPSSVGGDFWCHRNNLTHLVGAPSSVGGDFWCHRNKIWAFYGLSENFSTSSFECEKNPIYTIWNLFKSSEDIEFLNDCDALREPENPHSLPICYLERLNFFLETIGKPTVEKVDGYINI